MAVQVRASSHCNLHYQTSSWKKVEKNLTSESPNVVGSSPLPLSVNVDNRVYICVSYISKIPALRVDSQSMVHNLSVEPIKTVYLIGSIP